MKPYDYQEPVISAVITALITKMAVLFVMATGLGKTIVSAFVVRYRLRKGERGLFICHETGILAQAEGEYRKVIGNNLLYKTFYGQSTKDWTADTADMLFASFQSLNNWHEKWYEAFDPNHFDFMVVDESHHGQAPTYKEVIDYFNCKKIGMTATPDREDGEEIREIFGKEVANIPLEEGIANGWLSDVEYHILSDGISTQKLKKICKDVLEEGQKITVKQLNETIFVKARDEEEAKIIKDYSQGKKAMIFCESIDHANKFAQYLDNVRVSHSKLSERQNKQSMADFREGKAQYIVTVDKFNEGIDIPDTEVVVFLRSTDSKTIFFQQLGRGLRKTALKDKVIVLDFVANCDRLALIEGLTERIRRHRKGGWTKEKFNVSGDNFEFIFADELRDVLQLIALIKKGFYKTWQEASKVCIGSGISSQVDYGKRRKFIDFRLPRHPEETWLKDFPGWNVFLGKELAPKGWMTSYNLFLSENISVNYSRLKKSLYEYRKDHPKWFGMFYSSMGRLFEYLSPELISVLIERFPVKDQVEILRRKEEIEQARAEGKPSNYPEGWMTPGVLIKKPGFIGTQKTVSIFAEKYRKDHPEWFGVYYRANSKLEHYNPYLCSLIIDEFTGRKKAPKGWMTANILKKKEELVGAVSTIEEFAEKYRKDHPKWFGMFYLANSRFHTHYGPKLCKLIVKKFHPSKRKRKKGYLMTAFSIIKEYNLQLSAYTLKDYVEQYRGVHPEWFIDRIFGKTKSDFYTKELIKKILEEFGENGRKPILLNGWMTAVGLARTSGGSLTKKAKKISNFANQYREDHQDWFKLCRRGGKLCDQYHPDLVKLIKQKFTKK